MIHRPTPNLPETFAAHAFPIVSFPIAKFPFFSKLLLMIALAMFVFVGQAPSQGPSVSLTHVPDAGGTEGIVSGQGTTFTVRISQTGVNNFPGISASAGLNVDLAFDASAVSLTGTGGLLPSPLKGGIRLTLLAPIVGPLVVPESVDLTFTTVADVTGMEFTIEITGVSSTGLSIPLSETLTFNDDTGMPPDPLSLPLHLDTQIESPAQNNSVLTFTDNRPGDTLQIQLFVPDAAGQDIQAFALELALQGKTFDRFIGSISGSDWMEGPLFSGLSASDNPTLSGLFLNAAPVPGTGYLGQIDLEVRGVLTDEDTLIVTRASLAMAGGTLQSLDVSNAELSFVPVSLCPGDFDDNGLVNMADFVLFGGVFGTRSSDAGYNALMDMDDSGAIDVADFLLFVKVFDTTCETKPPPGGGGDGQAGVTIPDANLRAVIEDSLSKASGASITSAEMASLTRLEAPNANISDLTGLELATGLTVLNLGYEVMDNTIVNSNSISNITPLSGLTNLKELDLGSNSISDITPLSGLTRLAWLDLAYNSISDITPLSGLTRLAWLELSDNRISNITPLSGLAGLTNLYLRFNNISDISSLSSLTNLTVLWLRQNNISDIAPLVANTGLSSGDRVDVRSNPLSATSRDTHIPTLQDRGVTVQF